MAMKPNYNFEKRQRELAKKKQQDEKRLKKQQAKTGSKDPAGDGPSASRDTSETGSR
jgi:hypothetical protein